jgi:hypothetical protein
MDPAAVSVARGDGRQLLRAAAILTVGVGFVVVLAVRPESAARRPATVDELPPWFGEPDLPAVRIHGRVHSQTLPLMVHLAVDAPDPGIWRGLDVQTTLDGQFDFGPLRAGRYLVQAFGTSDASRVMNVDTTVEVGGVDVYSFPCREVKGFVLERRPGELANLPLTSARIELAGRDVATTDSSGRFRLCGPKESFELLTHSPGYAVTTEHVSEELPGPELYEVVSASRSLSLQATVTSEGKPVANIGIQAIRDNDNHHFPYSDQPMAVTTDEQGRFRFDGLSPGAYGFRVWRRSVYQDLPGRFDLHAGHNRIELVIPTGSRDEHRFDFLRPRAPGDPDGAWVRGRVVRDGEPVPDAIITGQLKVRAAVRSNDSTRSRADGSFALFVGSVYLDGSLPLSISVSHPVLRLTGSASVSVSPGEQVGDVSIEVR